MAECLDCVIVSIQFLVLLKRCPYYPLNDLKVNVVHYLLDYPLISVALQDTDNCNHALIS